MQAAPYYQPRLDATSRERPAIVYDKNVLRLDRILLTASTCMQNLSQRTLRKLRRVASTYSYTTQAFRKMRNLRSTKQSGKV
eukprot:SAG31_NODE_44816_length_261_cov_0.641975_1_plen_81_part_01